MPEKECMHACALVCIETHARIENAHCTRCRMCNVHACTPKKACALRTSCKHWHAHMHTKMHTVRRAARHTCREHSDCGNAVPGRRIAAPTSQVQASGIEKVRLRRLRGLYNACHTCYHRTSVLEQRQAAETRHLHSTATESQKPFLQQRKQLQARPNCLWGRTNPHQKTYRRNTSEDVQGTPPNTQTPRPQIMR